MRTRGVPRINPFMTAFQCRWARGGKMAEYVPDFTLSACFFTVVI